MVQYQCINSCNVGMFPGVHGTVCNRAARHMILSLSRLYEKGGKFVNQTWEKINAKSIDFWGGKFFSYLRKVFQVERESVYSLFLLLFDEQFSYFFHYQFTKSF